MILVVKNYMKNSKKIDNFQRKKSKLFLEILDNLKLTFDNRMAWVYHNQRRHLRKF
jgi:hypothetical protein